MYRARPTPGPRRRHQGPAGAFSADPDRLQRFEQEARAAAALNHPNILAVYDIGSTTARRTSSRSCSKGETLRERLTGGALPVRKAIEYAVQIAHGLAAAHEKGIVHRDLKPENVFVTTDGRVKILDFGLAKLTQAEPALAGASAAADDAARHGAGHRARHDRLHGARAGARAARPIIAPTSSRSARSSTRCCRASVRSAATPRPTR